MKDKKAIQNNIIPQIDDSFQAIKDAYEEAKAKYQKEFDNNPIHAIQWRTEDIIEAQAKYEFSLQIHNFWKAIKEDIKEGSVQAIHNRTTEYQEWADYQKNNLLSMTPRYGSSSAASNLIDLLQYKAKASFFGGNFGNFSDNFIKNIEKAKNILITG
jgi:lysyl-tRNA synthetase class I